MVQALPSRIQIFSVYVADIDMHHGCAASALQRGSQGIYLFNECYTESSRPVELKTMLQTIGDLQTLRTVSRRHPITYPAHRAPGDSARTILPIPLIPRSIGSDIGRMEHNITLRIHIGPKPLDGRAILLLVFSTDTPRLDPEKIQSRLNGTVICPCATPPKSAVYLCCLTSDIPYSEYFGLTLGYELPLDSLCDDTNVVEFIPPEVTGYLCWAEIFIQPSTLLQ